MNFLISSYIKTKRGTQPEVATKEENSYNKPRKRNRPHQTQNFRMPAKVEWHKNHVLKTGLNWPVLPVQPETGARSNNAKKPIFKWADKNRQNPSNWYKPVKTGNFKEYLFFIFYIFYIIKVNNNLNMISSGFLERLDQLNHRTSKIIGSVSGPVIKHKSNSICFSFRQFYEQSDLVVCELVLTEFLCVKTDTQ